MTNDLFFDTDCLSAFLWINDTNILQALYAGKIVIPDPVYQEMSNPCIPHIKRRADALVCNNIATVQQLNVGTEEYTIYRELLKGTAGNKAIGKGEAAGIALTKTHDGILASNNYADIAPYIKKYNLRHVDTGHILLEALEKGVITEKDGNDIWQKMLDKNRKLPAGSFTE
ncbi:MAG: hypothetical protein IJ353_02315, partial [Lachnospiraceae bacterium]|nr:hypothetical protein [Lachnospiraceae bacterium]